MKVNGNAATVAATSVLRAFAAIGGMAAGGVFAVGLLTVVEGFWARQRLFPTQILDVSGRTGLFGDAYEGEPIELALLGDSLAVGVGAEDPDQTVGVLLANGVASASRRPVRLRNVAVIGSESKDLSAQIDALVDDGVHLQVVVILVGGNEVMHLQSIGTAVQHLSTAVRDLRQMGCHVVVATCPDMGTVRPFSQPLRFFAHWLSRVLATAQTIVVLRSGGRSVSLADTLGPLFRREPTLMFSTDHLHPSSHGYTRAAEVLLPSVCAAASLWTGEVVSVPHRVYRRDRRRPLAWFAFRAARRAGTELNAAHHRGQRLVEVGRHTVNRYRSSRQLTDG